MFRYILRRIFQAIPTIFGITLLSYLLITAAPGGPVGALGVDPKLTPEKRRILEAQLGVNDPWPVQYLKWLVGDDWLLVDKNGDGEKDGYGNRRGVLRGDFGNSFSGRRPVIDMIAERTSATLELGITSLVVGSILGVIVGILAAVNRGGWFDNLSRVFAVITKSIPIFWLGLMLILIFGATLHVLPMGGRCPRTTGDCPSLLNRTNYILLPALVLSAGAVSVLSRYMRASMLDVIHQEYVRTARAKGLRQRRVWFTHAARNALIPIATLMGPSITGILGGAVITETIFSWPGLGRLTFQAVLQQDYPLVMAGVLIAALGTLGGFILSDILYALVDPRIRFN
ncbi:MAG: ABC transporter permease [Anaerolineae bacterium]|nr:ABC transporter permease [Anaerolineae bacterium]